MSKNLFDIETQCVQGTYDPEKAETRVLPIYQSTTYKYDDSQHLADLFDLKKGDDIYTRLSNPTTSEFEGKIALLEGGVGALAAASGMSAVLMAVLNICQAGDEIISSSALYGGTYNLFDVTLRKLGITVIFVDPDATFEEITSKVSSKTKILYGETIGNPGMNILNMEVYAKAAQTMEVPFMVDNTLPTPYLCRPIEYGANIVIHSSSKYLDGHAVALGGVIVDGGNFDWNNGKFPGLSEPDNSYNGLVYTETFGSMAFILKARVQMARDLGCVISPFNSFLTHLGMETLHLRMERHSENALKLAEYLETNKHVAWVNYPGLSSSPYHKWGKKYMPKGFGGILTFGIKGGEAAGKKLVEHFKFVKLVTHLGDVRTSVIHPGSTTHRQLSEERQKTTGVTPDLIRVSVGIENIDDIILDFKEALEGCSK